MPVLGDRDRALDAATALVLGRADDGGVLADAEVAGRDLGGLPGRGHRADRDGRALPRGLRARARVNEDGNLRRDARGLRGQPHRGGTTVHDRDRRRRDEAAPNQGRGHLMPAGRQARDGTATAPGRAGVGLPPALRPGRDRPLDGP